MQLTKREAQYGRPNQTESELPWWRSPIYRTWEHMIERCENPRCKSYRLYGAKGIKVCPRWRASYDAFCEDMGPRPSPFHSLDRIDGSKDYDPGNCRWATIQVQNQNTTRTKLDEESVRQIRCLRALGINQKWVAKLYNVGPTTIAKAERGLTWSNIAP